MYLSAETNIIIITVAREPKSDTRFLQFADAGNVANRIKSCSRMYAVCTENVQSAIVSHRSMDIAWYTEMLNWKFLCCSDTCDRKFYFVSSQIRRKDRPGRRNQRIALPLRVCSPRAWVPPTFAAPSVRKSICTYMQLRPSFITLTSVVHCR